MQVVDIFLKLELWLDDKDDAKKIAGELCRQLQKSYAVRNVELSNIVQKD